MMTWALRLKQAGSLDNPPSPDSNDSSPQSPPQPDNPSQKNKNKPVPTTNRQKLAENFQKASKEKQAKKAATKKRQKQDRDANKFRPSSLSYRGCHLLSSLEKFHLVEQQRASQDAAHNTFVQKLSKGKLIQIEDILAYKPLSADDTAGESSHDWKFAPILVATNAERLQISRFKARLWAIEHQTHVFKWRRKVGKEQNRPRTTDMMTITENNAFFWQFWVAGAPCNLSHNVNCDLALVNGAPMTAHSLTFCDPNEFERVQSMTSGPNALPFGSEIEIDVPLALNMVVSASLDNREISTHRKHQLDQLKKLSIDPNSNDIVIPLTKTMKSSKTTTDTKFTYLTGNPLSPLATAQTFDIFAFDLAFAMTVHKAQGRTIRRVVIDLTHRPTQMSQMKFAAIFVAMSRVQKTDHIRLLTHRRTGKQFDPQQAYSYITTLKPDDNVMSYYAGFPPTQDSNDNGVFWSPSLALAFNSAEPSNN